jgi:hypothetical protein
VYKIKKGEYDNTVLALESDRLHLDNAIEENIAGIQSEESNYHFLNCLLATTQIKIQQMECENKYCAEPNVMHVRGKFSSYKDEIENAIRERENANRDMRTEKKNIGETHEDNVLQRRMFGNLKKLLTCKKLLVEAGLKPNSMLTFDGLQGGEKESFDATAVGERMSFD